MKIPVFEVTIGLVGRCAHNYAHTYLDMATIHRVFYFLRQHDTS